MLTGNVTERDGTTHCVVVPVAGRNGPKSEDRVGIGCMPVGPFAAVVVS